MTKDLINSVSRCNLEAKVLDYRHFDPEEANLRPNEISRFRLDFFTPPVRHLDRVISNTAFEADVQTKVHRKVRKLVRTAVRSQQPSFHSTLDILVSKG